MANHRDLRPGPDQARSSTSDLQSPAPGRTPLTARLQPAAQPVQRKTTPEAGRPAGASQPLATGGEWTHDPMMDAAHRGTGLPVQARGGVATDPGDVQSIAAQGVSGSGGALPHLDRIQRSFGAEHDVSGVRAHTDSAAASASQKIGASAFATGNDVAFTSTPDLHTAAHEAAHVVQQRHGVELAGGVGREGDAYEQHADAVANRVVSGQSAADLLGGTDAKSSAVQRRAVQRVPDATTYATTTRSSLSPELQAGLADAQANPTSVPSPLPAWIESGNRPLGLSNPDTAGKPYNSKEKKQFQHKWGKPYNNNDGNLPGVVGAGGYNEYYAQPDSSSSDIFGKNRILRQTNDPDGLTYWWATSDHYVSVAHITDA
jgi:hypothetical protein